MSLRDNVHQLTRDHLKTDPNNRPHKVPALLDELRAAVTPGNSGSSGGASGPPIPINADALDLLRQMEIDAATDYREMTGDAWSGTLAALLQHMARMELTPEWLAYLERVTLQWIDDITAFLWPVKPRRKLTGTKCPSCGDATYGDERKVCLSLGCWDDTGGLAKIGEWNIECAGCNAGWSGDRVTWLLRALDTPSEVLTHSG
jgi:hypothetical protein